MATRFHCIAHVFILGEFQCIVHHKKHLGKKTLDLRPKLCVLQLKMWGNSRCSRILHIYFILWEIPWLVLYARVACMKVPKLYWFHFWIYLFISEFDFLVRCSCAMHTSCVDVNKDIKNGAVAWVKFSESLILTSLTTCCVNYVFQ